MKTKLKVLAATLIITINISSCSKDNEAVPLIPTLPIEVVRVDTFTYVNDEVETFTFITGGVETEGLIYLPEAYETNSELPAIYLLDFQEQHFTVVTDEFAQLINAAREMPNFDAVIVSLKALPAIDAHPATYQTACDVIKDMSFYVDSVYINNSSKTFVARGSEGGVVLLTLLNEDPEANVFDNYIATDSPASFNSAVTEIIESGTISKTMLDKKLHFSYSLSNNQEDCQALISSFEEMEYPWLTFESEDFNGEFPSVYPDVFAAGLEFVFE